MAQNDSAVLIAGTGAVWFNTSGATAPTYAQILAYAAAGTVPSGQTSIGHTSLSDLPAPAQDGGDTSVLGSWQNKQLITSVTSPPVDSVELKSLQILDQAVLGFYHGGGTYTSPNQFDWPDTPSPQQQSWTFIYCHSATRVLGLYVPNGSVYRGDAIAFDNSDLTTVPLKITFLKMTGKPKASWIGTALGA